MTRPIRSDAMGDIRKIPTNKLRAMVLNDETWLRSLPPSREYDNFVNVSILGWQPLQRDEIDKEISQVYPKGNIATLTAHGGKAIAIIRHLWMSRTSPTQEERQAARKQFFADYDKAHTCCPVCGGRNIISTTAAWFGENGDNNRANCQDCKWYGIVDDLKPGSSDA